MKKSKINYFNMSNILFINDSFPADLRGICDYKNFRPSNTEIFSPDFTFNQYAHKKLEEIFCDKKYDLIILPYSLSTGNYLSYTGISVALQVRLTPKWKHHKIPILFIGSESIEELLKFAPNPFIFSTSGIFTTKKRSKEDIGKQINWVLANRPSISDREYQNFLSRINLIPPEFYDNRHSIANEWALIFLDSVSKHNVLTLHPKLQEIKSNLFIKWKLIQNQNYLTKNVENKKPIFRIKNADNKKVLLIDDEWSKGWFSLYKSFFGDACQFDYLNISKGDNEGDILRLLKERIQEDWDLFIVDIRLTDNDHNSNKYKKYTGFKIVEEIKKNNRGNQVIITSASNKQWIYDYGQRQLEVNGIIIKHDFNSEPYSIDLNESYSKVIQKCFNDLFKKEIFKSQVRLIVKLNVLRKQKKLQRELVRNIELFLTLAFNALQINHEESLTISFLNYFQVFEYLAKEFISDEKKEISSGSKKYYWELRDGSEKLVKINIDNPQTSHSIFITVKGRFVPTPQKLYNILFL